MSKPIAVLVSDVHYNVHTLPLADAAMRQAITKANELEVPLIVAGDLHDSKANMRAECVNAMIETFKLCQTDCYILRGNHDSINEKSQDHSLNFLQGFAEIVSTGPKWCDVANIWLMPYYNDAKLFVADSSGLLALRTGRTPILVCHQGIQGSNSGEYIQDKSAITKDDVKDFRVVSGHYHARQDIKTGRPQKGAVGLFSYIGNPYTLNFGEANDPPKGFQILMGDGTLEFVPTNLRNHVVIETHHDDTTIKGSWNERDLIWVKYKGTKEQLLSLTKDKVAKNLHLTGIDFRLDFIPIDTVTEAPKVNNQTQHELLDTLIDSLTNTSDERKARLKELWRKSVCG